MSSDLDRAAGLRALAIESRALAGVISLRPDREALLRDAEELEAAAGRLDGTITVAAPRPPRIQPRTGLGARSS
jgi:hypothetical protein